MLLLSQQLQWPTTFAVEYIPVVGAEAGNGPWGLLTSVLDVDRSRNHKHA